MNSLSINNKSIKIIGKSYKCIFLDGFFCSKKTDSSDFSACDARLALLIDADSVFVDQRVQGLSLIHI